MDSQIEKKDILSFRSISIEYYISKRKIVETLSIFISLKYFNFPYLQGLSSEMFVNKRKLYSHQKQNRKICMNKTGSSGSIMNTTTITHTIMQSRRIEDQKETTLI